MHVHTVRTKYTFGDRVRFASRFNGSGSGVVDGICINGPDEPYYYFIRLDDGSGETAGGIYDDDITPLTDADRSPAGATGNSQG